jgi:hypothetical protein
VGRVRDHRPTADDPKLLERTTDFLKTGTGVITAVATLLVAVTGLVTAITQLTGDDDAPVAAASSESDEATTPGDPIDAELWSHIPAGIQATCRRSTDQEEGSVAAYNCTHRRIVGLQYNLFPSGADLETGYAAVKERYGVEGSGDSCEQGDYEGDWVGEGSMLCFVGDDGVAAIVWSDTELDILSFAWRDDGKLPELYDAWRSGVGPER